MKLAIFPLGNPGDKYRLTRHNAARLVLEYMSTDFIHMCEAAGLAHVNVITPDTYMNESGLFIAKYMKNQSDNVLPVIMYDDKDLALGVVKLSYGNSSGGHNGVESVIQHMGPNFYRVRIGIGNKDIMPIHGAGVVQDFVMSNFNSVELEVLKSQTLHDAVVQCLLKISP